MMTSLRDFASEMWSDRETRNICSNHILEMESAKETFIVVKEFSLRGLQRLLKGIN